jgi:hypothetical protein
MVYPYPPVLVRCDFLITSPRYIRERNREYQLNPTEIITTMKSKMSGLLGLAIAAAALLAAPNTWAWRLDGSVKCASGTSYPGVVINVSGTNCNGNFTGSVTTDANGNYLLAMPECDGGFTATIDTSTLPPGSTVVSPGVSHDFTFTGSLFIVEGTINWIVDSSICGTTPPPCVPVSSCITSDFNGTPIAGGNTIWLNSITKITGRSGGPATIFYDSASVTFTVGGTPVTVPIPPAIIKFDASATTATTTFDTGLGAWVTTVPVDYTGNVFLSGAAYKLPANYPGGIKPVTW